MRRAFPLFLTVLLAPLLALLAPPAQAGNEGWKDGQLVLLSSQLPTFLPGQRGWIGLPWTATTDVCDVAVTATAPGATISYPANTASFSSLYTNDALAATNRDYTAFNVALDPSTTRATTVTLRATYTKIPPGQIAKSDDLTVKEPKCTGGQKVTETSTVTLPVGSPSGERAVLETTTASVSAGDPTWVPLSFRTQYAGLDDFRVQLNAPSGLEVVYPGDGTSSGLAKAPALPVGGSDAASVRLRATSLDPGTYRIPVRASWNGGSVDTELSLTVR